jgi:hypothetical protein
MKTKEIHSVGSVKKNHHEPSVAMYAAADSTKTVNGTTAFFWQEVIFKISSCEFGARIFTHAGPC